MTLPKTPYELFYIECGKGWESLYKPLIEKIEKYGGRVMQVKEKFGGLRFYYSGLPLATEEQAIEFNELVNTMEAKSFTICEECGDHGRLRKGGWWLKTLCDKHHKDGWRLKTFYGKHHLERDKP